MKYGSETSTPCTAPDDVVPEPRGTRGCPSASPRSTGRRPSGRARSTRRTGANVDPDASLAAQSRRARVAHGARSADRPAPRARPASAPARRRHPSRPGRTRHRRACRARAPRAAPRADRRAVADSRARDARRASRHRAPGRPPRSAVRLRALLERGAKPRRQIAARARRRTRRRSSRPAPPSPPRTGRRRMVPARAADELDDLRDHARRACAAAASGSVNSPRAQLDAEVRQERRDDRGAVVAIGDVEQRERDVGRERRPALLAVTREVLARAAGSARARGSGTASRRARGCRRSDRTCPAR